MVDEWAARFFEELDYVNEGENGTYFAEMMKKDLPQVLLLSNQIHEMILHFHHLNFIFMLIIILHILISSGVPGCHT